MWWMFGFAILAAVIFLLYIRTEGLTREHKRLLVQHKMLEQDSVLLQQHTYELAEELSQTLQQQLQQARRMTRLSAETLQIFEVCLRAVPAICKEVSCRQQSLQQAMHRYLQMHSELSLAQVDSEMNRHGRLVPYWQQRTFAAYLQLCQQLVLLVKDNAHKENFRQAESA